MFEPGREMPFGGGAHDDQNWVSVKMCFNLKSIIFGPGRGMSFWGGAHDDQNGDSVKRSFNLKSIIIQGSSENDRFGIGTG